MNGTPPTPSAAVMFPHFQRYDHGSRFQAHVTAAHINIEQPSYNAVLPSPLSNIRGWKQTDRAVPNVGKPYVHSEKIKQILTESWARIAQSV